MKSAFPYTAHEKSMSESRKKEELKVMYEYMYMSDFVVSRKFPPF